MTTLTTVSCVGPPRGVVGKGYWGSEGLASADRRRSLCRWGDGAPGIGGPPRWRDTPDGGGAAGRVLIGTSRRRNWRRRAVVSVFAGRWRQLGLSRWLSELLLLRPLLLYWMVLMQLLKLRLLLPLLVLLRLLQLLLLRPRLWR